MEPAMQTTINLKFRYRKDEYFRAIRFHFWKTMKLKLDLVVAVLSGLAGGYLLWIDAVSWISLTALLACLVLLLIVFTALVVVPAQIYKGSQKLKQDYELIFSDEGILFRTSSIDSRLAWDLYKSWIENAEFFILYHGKREFSVIPKRAFENDEEQKRFKELLAGKVAEM
jgi:YcxB-like protein